MTEHADRAVRVVRIVPSGPIMVQGPVRIETSDGVVESDRFMVAICTCRRSGSYPLCDTSRRLLRAVPGHDRPQERRGTRPRRCDAGERDRSAPGGRARRGAAAHGRRRAARGAQQRHRPGRRHPRRAVRVAGPGEWHLGLGAQPRDPAHHRPGRPAGRGAHRVPDLERIEVRRRRGRGDPDPRPRRDPAADRQRRHRHRARGRRRDHPRARQRHPPERRRLHLSPDLIEPLVDPEDGETFVSQDEVRFKAGAEAKTVYLTYEAVDRVGRRLPDSSRSRSCRSTRRRTPLLVLRTSRLVPSPAAR